MNANAGGRGAIAAALLLVVLSVPFAGRAHHIDDPLYLQAARHVLRAPLDPLGGASFWHERPTTLFHDLYNPPLVAYLLAGPASLGGSERAVHLFMIGLAALAVLAAAGAGRALGVAPRWTLLLAASPALAVSAVSSMADVPFLLLSLLAWWAALRGRAAAAGALAGASALTKYAGLVNVPLTVLALGGRRKKAVAAVAAALLFAGWCLWNVALHGETHVAAASRFQEIGLRHQGALILSFVASLGLAGLPAALGLLRWSRPAVVALIAAGLGGGALVHRATGSASAALLATAALGAGASLLVAALRASLRKGAGFPAWGFWLHAFTATLLVYFGAARYLLVLLAPLLWLLVRGGELEEEARPWRWAASVSIGVLLSLAFLKADAGYANAWRAAAEALPPAEQGLHTGRWGFEAYATARGYRALGPRDELRRGDVVAQPRGIHVVPPTPAQAALLTRTSAIAVPSPALRVMDAEAAAGFYSSAWGLLPLGFRPGAREVVDLWTPAPWIFPLLEEPPEGPVVVDLGSPEARHVLLDGWSGEEAFEEGGRRRTFVWALGPDSALRLPLPRGLRRLRVTAFPAPEAVGPMRVEIGREAHAVVPLAAGWRSYDVAVEGDVPGGPTTVVLRPAGRRRPWMLSRERRELCVAVDVLVFGEGPAAAANRGVWPVPVSAGSPGLLLMGQRRGWPLARGCRRVQLRLASDDAELVWKDDRASLVLWRTASRACGMPEGCPVELTTPGAGVLLLRGERVHLLDAGIRAAPP